MSRRRVPLLALCAAFSFVIMMFNVPVFGGTSAHAVGAVFIAIIMGPWAACISVSTALLIQAVVFGDGGILAFGVNCLNMAVIMPFAGYAVYRLIAGRSGGVSKRRIAGAFIGSYAGLNLAAFCAAIELGIQPILFKSANGTPLYCPYPLSVSIPSMLFAHGLFAGPLEAVITAAALALVVKFYPDIITDFAKTQEDEEQFEHNKPDFRSRFKGLIIALAVLIVLTPVGLLANGSAWGEWNSIELKNKIGYIPRGFEKISGWWKAVMPDYSLPRLGSGSFASISGYILSAAVGVLLILLVVLISSRLMLRFKKAGKAGKN
jgi:cobalt/nickel transport system permease protein